MTSPCFTFLLQRYVLARSSFSQPCCCHIDVCQRKTTWPFGDLWLKPLQVLTFSWELTASIGKPGGWSSSFWLPGCKYRIFHPGFGCIGTGITYQLFVSKLLQAAILSPSNLSSAFTSTFCPVVVISTVAARSASQCRASSYIGSYGVTSVLPHLASFCKKENSPYDSSYATT